MQAAQALKSTSLCGDIAWTEKAEMKYREWIKELVKKEAFKVQNIRLSAHSIQAAATIKEKLLVTEGTRGTLKSKKWCSAPQGNGGL